MAHRLRPDRAPAAAASWPYVLMIKGRDRRPRIQRFAGVASYRTRLEALRPSNDPGMSMDEVIDWLDSDLNQRAESPDE